MQMRPPLAYQRSSKLHRAHTACYRAAKFYSERRKPFLDRCSLSEAAAGGDPWLWWCNFTTGRSPFSTPVSGGGARQPGRSPLAFPRSPLCNEAVTKSSARYISTSAFLEYKAVLFFKNLFLFVTMAPNLVFHHFSRSFLFVCFFKILYFWFFYSWSALCYCKAYIAIVFMRASVVRPFVKPIFPERVKQINAKLAYLFTISPDKFCLLFKIWHFDFYDFFFHFR